FLFFQAEDGIRDRNVTGVQTCALPIFVSMLDLGTHYRLVVNTVEAVTPEEEAPKLPVARVVWKPNPGFKSGVQQWLEAGGGHHTVLTLVLEKEVILDWAKMVDLEVVLID